MALWAGISGRLVGGRVAGDEGEPFGSRVQAVAAEHLPDPVGRDDDAAPLGPGQLAGYALGAETRVGDREAEDPLLDHLRQLVGHPRTAPLSGTQHLEAVAIDLALPGIEGRAVHPEAPAGLRDAGAGGLGKEGLAVAEQHVILGHAAPFLNFIGVKPGA